MIGKVMSREGSALLKAYKRRVAFSSPVYEKVEGKKENASGLVLISQDIKFYLLHAA